MKITRILEFFLALNCLSCVSDAWSMETSRAYLTAVHNDKVYTLENFYLVHATNLIPKDGILVPSNGISDKENKIHYLNYTQTPPLRKTIHFTLGHLVNDIEEQGAIWSDRCYAVLVPGEEALSPIGGYVGDIFFKSPFKLPSTSIIIARSKEDALNLPERFNIVCLEEEETMRDGVNRIIEQNGRKIFKVENDEVFLDDQKVNQKAFLSSFYSEFQFGRHFSSPLYTLEKILRYLSSPFHLVAFNYKVPSDIPNKDTYKYSFECLKSLLEHPEISTKFPKWIDEIRTWLPIFQLENDLREKSKTLFKNYDLVNLILQLRTKGQNILNNSEVKSEIQNLPLFEDIFSQSVFDFCTSIPNYSGENKKTFEFLLNIFEKSLNPDQKDICRIRFSFCRLLSNTTPEILDLEPKDLREEIQDKKKVLEIKGGEGQKSVRLFFRSLDENDKKTLKETLEELGIAIDLDEEPSFEEYEEDYFGESEEEENPQNN